VKGAKKKGDVIRSGTRTASQVDRGTNQTKSGLVKKKGPSSQGEKSKGKKGMKSNLMARQAINKRKFPTIKEIS